MTDVCFSAFRCAPSDRVGKRQPDWHRLVWEASGRTVNRLEALSQMERVRSLHEASLRGEQGASDGSDSDEDEHEHIFDRSNDHIMRQKMSKRQRIAASVDGFRNSKLGVKEVRRLPTTILSLEKGLFTCLTGEIEGCPVCC